MNRCPFARRLTNWQVKPKDKDKPDDYKPAGTIDTSYIQLGSGAWDYSTGYAIYNPPYYQKKVTLTPYSTEPITQPHYLQTTSECLPFDGSKTVNVYAGYYYNIVEPDKVTREEYWVVHV